MNIQQIKRIIHRYLTGKASQDETLLVNEWLRADGQDAISPDRMESDRREKIVLTRLQTHIRMNRSGDIASLTPDPGEPTDEMYAVIRPLIRKWWMAAACTILIAGAFISWAYRYRILDIVNPIPVQRISAGSFSVREVLLPDSSVVILNSMGTVSYPARFRGGSREVAVTGQAFFKVRSRSQQPFIVYADSLQVQVLGTSFVVSNDHAGRLATVGVTSGKVAVRYDREGFPETMLTPGRELQYDKYNTKITVVGNAPVSTGWTTKRLIFEATPLPDVFYAVERSYGKIIRYQAAALHNQAFTGSFDKTDALPEVLKVLSLSYGLAIQQNKDGSLTIR